MPASLCTFPGCIKPVAWGGLCNAHQMQRQRGQALRALRERGKPGVRLPVITVSVDCAKALELRGPTIYRAAREVLEWWAVVYVSGLLTAGTRPGDAPAPKKKRRPPTH